MPSILVADSYYPAFLGSVHGSLVGLSYREGLRKLLAFRFGTADFLTAALRRFDWEAEDIVSNCEDLQSRWRRENGSSASPGEDTLVAQVAARRPDVVAMQVVHLVSERALREIRNRCGLLVGFASYNTEDSWFQHYDAVFTSFPHYLSRIDRAGGKAILSLLAFEPSVVEEAGGEKERDIDCSFVGGLSIPRIWSAGQRTLEAVAAGVPGFQCWGYCGGSSTGSLRSKWRGEAWGLDMYRIYLRSKLVVNRHGEIASGYANNMRLYEAAGCGAAVLTESATNLSSILEPGSECETYSSPDECVAKVLALLADEPRRAAIAAAGRGRVLREHSYAARARQIDARLRAELSRRVR